MYNIFLPLTACHSITHPSIDSPLAINILPLRHQETPNRSTYRECVFVVQRSTSLSRLSRLPFITLLILRNETNWFQQNMKVITANFVTCAVKECKVSPSSFPLHFHDAELEMQELDFQPEFIRNVIPRIDWEGLRVTANEVIDRSVR